MEGEDPMMIAASAEEAMSLLDEVFGPPSPELTARIKREQENAILKGLGLFLTQDVTTMGGIQTKGCPKCHSTMYKTYETDKDGNVTSESQYVCNSCGHVE